MHNPGRIQHFMNDMYEKLGELLNSAIENKEFPEIAAEESESKAEFYENESTKNDIHSKIEREQPVISEQCQPFSENNRKIRLSFLKKLSEKQKNKQTSTIMHKNCINMHFPLEIQNALITLDIAYPISIKNIKRSYRNKLKSVHPDKVNPDNLPKITIQTSYNVYNTIQLTPEILTKSYDLLINYFTV